MESELVHDRTSDDSIQTNSLMVQYDYGSVCHPYRRLGRVQELSIVNVPGAWVWYSRTRKCGETRPARSAKYPPVTALHTVIGRKWEKVGESGSLHRMALSDQILHQWAVTPSGLPEMM